MVMVPVSAEQPDNAKKMASRETGIVLNILTVTAENIVQALDAVINDTRWGDSNNSYNIVPPLLSNEGNEQIYFACKEQV